MAAAPEGKKKRVVRAVVGYGVVAFALLQVIEPLMHGLHLPDATLSWALAALALAFPVVVAVAFLTGREEAPARLHPAWFMAAAAALLLAIGAFLFSRRTARAPRAPTLAQITFEGGIEEYPAWSPDGKRIAYVAQSGKARKIFIKDLASETPKQVTHGDADDLHPSWSPDGARLVFMRAQDPKEKLMPGDVFGGFYGADVWQLELSTGKETKLLAEALNPSFGRSGQLAVDAPWSGAHRIWVLDGNGRNAQQVTTDTSEETNHLAPRFSPDGKKIVFQVQQRTRFDIRVVDLETKRQTSITDDFPLDVEPEWSPSGQFIYFTSDRGGGYNIWRAPMDAEGKPAGPLQQVTTGAGQDVEPAAFGRQLAFSTLRQNADLWKLPVDPVTGAATGEPQAVVATTREESRGAWSPDMSAIAFNSDRNGEMHIWVRSLNDGSDRRLTSGAGGDFQPNWSPDGKRIAFFSSRLGRPRIFTVAAAGGEPAPLTAGEAVEVNPFFSPDGKWVAFQSDKSGRAEVWIVPSGGGAERQLTNDGVIGHFMRWTRDSAAVLFSCRCGGKRALAKAPLNGEMVQLAPMNAGSHMSFSPSGDRMMDVIAHRALTVFDPATGAAQKVFEFPDPNVRIDYPVWSPDGRWVLFERNRPEGGDVWVVRDVE